MARALLTLDLGNSRRKLRLWSTAGGEGARPALLAALDQGYEREDDEVLRRFLAEHAIAPDAALVSVASAKREGGLREALARNGIEASTPEHGLALELEEPAGAGLDRLFAARGALALLGRSTLIVDLGTALTVDALLVEEGRGRFLGGAIAPGPALQAAALRAGTARLPDFEPVPDAPALGRSTGAALRAGLAHGLRGAVRELVRALGEEARLPEAPVVLTGGAARFAARAEERELGGHPLLREPELVHLGLWAARRR